MAESTSLRAEDGAPDSPPEPQRDAVARTHQIERILGRHCASCHGRAGADRDGPAARLGAITDLAGLARSHWVTPGDPDQSQLYAVLHAQHAPHEIFYPRTDRAGPTPEEIAAVRAWIAELPERGHCDDRARAATPRRVQRAIQAHLLRADGATRRDRRFVSLAHLWRACARLGDTNAHWQALERALAALSWRRQPVVLEPVPVATAPADARDALVREIRLSSLGWTAAQWDRLADHAVGELGRARLRGRRGRSIATITGAPIAVLPAEALVAAAFSPERYDDLLGAPDTLDGLAATLGTGGPRAGDLTINDMMRDATVSDEATRVGDAADGNAAENNTTERRVAITVARSHVTGGARRLRGVVEADRSLWLAQQMPAEGAADEDAAAVEALWSLFRLPGGATGFRLFNPDSGRAVAWSAAGDHIPSPAACMSCHAGGPRRARHADAAAPSAGRDVPGAGDPSGAQAPPLAFNAAVRAAQSLVWQSRGLDAVSRLMAVHNAPRDITRFAGEQGVSRLAMIGILSEMIATGDLIARRLSLGQISRAEADVLARRLINPTTASQIDDLGVGGGLAVWAEREQIRPGEDIVIHVASGRRCFPTVVGIEASGDATVLFPNGFEPPEQLRPGRVLTIPGPARAYRIRAKHPGVERLIAFCHNTEAPILGLEPDYARQVFTALGPWDEALFQASQRFQKPKLRKKVIWRRRRRRVISIAQDVPVPQRLTRAQSRYRVAR